MKLCSSTILMLGMALAIPSSCLASQVDDSNREIKFLVLRLSWDSLGMNCNVLGDICLQSEGAKKLVRIGKPATSALLKVLADENKSVAAHIILTQIWEPKMAHGTMRFGADRYVFIFNGLEWTHLFEVNGTKYKIKKSALTLNAEKWRRKIARLESSS